MPAAVYAARRCVIAAFAVSLAAAACTQAIAATWRTVRDPVLKVEFSLPARWVVTPGCHGRPGCLALSARPASADSYLIALETFSGDLEQVAADHAIFRRSARGWETTGRTDSAPVATIAGPGWRGVRSVVPCGIADQAGNHPAGGDCLWTVISNGRRSVVADTLGAVAIDADITRVIRSLRILPG